MLGHPKTYNNTHKTASPPFPFGVIIVCTITLGKWNTKNTVPNTTTAVSCSLILAQGNYCAIQAPSRQKN